MVFAASAQVSAQGASGERGEYLLGTATTGGPYHPVGVALSTLIKLKLLPQFDIDLTAINTEGPQQNINLLRQNDIQFAIVSALSSHEARNGTGEFADVGPDDNLRAITTLWLNADHFLVRDDTVKSGTINDFLELENRPVSLGRPESSVLAENQTVLSALGIDIDSNFELIELGFKDSADALASGEIDGMSASGGVPVSAVQHVFDLLGNRVTALEINDEQLKLIDGGRGLWQRAVIPSGTYTGQNSDILTIGTPNILAVRADVDEDIVYQITRTIFEELEYLHGLHDTTRQISLDNAVRGLPLAVHEGAARYFKEKGVDLPLPPVRLSSDLLVRYRSVEEAREATNKGVISMFAGTEGDTSAQMAAELTTVLDGNDDSVRLLATNGGGLGRNLIDLLYLRGVDTALMRADILNYALDQGVYPNFEGQLNYISEMFSEEVHLLVRSDIADLSDLVGKKINLGDQGSGTSVTASIILSQLGLRAEPTFFNPRMAIEKLEQGEIAGAFLVGGKPMPLLRQIDDASGLRLIAVPNIDYFDSYRTAEVSGYDYPNLMQADETVPTMAVRTALFTYAWRPRSQRYGALEGFTSELFASLLTLHEDGYHPKWKEIDPTAEFEGWQRFQPASLWLDDNQGTARRIASLGRARLNEQQTGLPAPTAEDPELPNETGAEAEFTPSSETSTPSEETVPAIDASDASSAAEAEEIAVPTAPIVELVPGIETVGEPLQTNGVPLEEAGASNSPAVVVPQPALSNVPAAGVKSPTF